MKITITIIDILIFIIFILCILNFNDNRKNHKTLSHQQTVIIEQQKELILKVNSLYRNQEAPIKIIGG